MRSSCLSFFLVFALCQVATAQENIMLGSFANTGLNGWERKVFKGNTEYELVLDGKTQVLKAESKAAASGLVFETDYNPHDYPILTWRWKIGDTIKGGDSRNKETDDYAARIYVVFPHWFFPMTKTINYIWANRLPKGQSQLSPYTSNDMMIAVESGPASAGQWLTVRRNVVEDYRKAFGAEPPSVGAIAIMTDTDNTGESAIAWYGDISASRE